MSSGVRLDWHEAVPVAQELGERLRSVCPRVKCVGSLRRKRPTVGDIEFVVEPPGQQNLFGGEAEPLVEPVEALVRSLGEWVKGGTKYMKVADVLGSGLTLDVFVVTPPAAGGSTVAIRTGPADLGRYVVTVCKDYRIQHTRGHAVHMDTRERVPTDTEEQFFGLAMVPLVPATQRDRLAERLWRERR